MFWSLLSNSNEILESKTIKIIRNFFNKKLFSFLNFQKLDKVYMNEFYESVHFEKNF